MTRDMLLRQIIDYDNRADPYPLYTELRKKPVRQEGDELFVVSTYWEIKSLLHDPRISSDARNLSPGAAGTLLQEEEASPLPPAFLRLDPPEHDRLRRMTMRPFGPPETPRRVHDMRGELTRIVADLIDGFGDRKQVDIVDDFSYPFPVTVICGCWAFRARTSRASTPGPTPSPPASTRTRTRTPASGAGSPSRPAPNWGSTSPVSSTHAARRPATTCSPSWSPGTARTGR